MNARAVGRWVSRIVLLGVAGLIAFAVAVLIVVPRATHGVALTVLTGSMTPKIPVGSVVIDRPVDPGTLKVGDIATYQKTAGKSEYITHRIIAINTKASPVTYTFKGDANRGPDLNPVPASAIRGKVWFHVPLLGSIRDSLQSHGMRGLALIIAILGLAAFGIYQIAIGLGHRNRRAQLTLRFAWDAFGDTEPATVARLFGGECDTDDATRIATLTFADNHERHTVIRDLLEPYQFVEANACPPTVPSSPPAASPVANHHA